jgi:hypothetical protein
MSAAMGYCVDLYAKELREIMVLIRGQKSVLVIGEAGSGKTTVAERLLERLNGFKVAIASYEGSSRQTLMLIAEQLEIPITNAKDKPLNMDQMKGVITRGCNKKTFIVCDNCHRWPSSLRYWLEGLHAKGVILLVLAIEDVRRDIFLRLVKVHLSTPTEDQIREIMTKEAVLLSFSFSDGKLAYLQQLAGSNPMIAKGLVQEACLGRYAEEGQHNRYINVAPFVNAVLICFGTVRFLGIGLSDRSLYVLGGMIMLLTISLRYIGNGLNQASRKKPLGKG